MEQAGFDVSGCFAAKEMRDKMAPVVPYLTNLPSGVSHSAHSWDNQTVSKVASLELSRLRKEGTTFFSSFGLILDTIMRHPILCKAL